MFDSLGLGKTDDHCLLSFYAMLFELNDTRIE